MLLYFVIYGEHASQRQKVSAENINSRQPSGCVQAVNSSRFCLWSRIFHTSEDSEISVRLSDSARYTTEAKSNFYQQSSERLASYFESAARQPARQQGQKDRHCVVFMQRREGVSAFPNIHRGLGHGWWGQQERDAALLLGLPLMGRQNWSNWSPLLLLSNNVNRLLCNVSTACWVPVTDTHERFTVKLQSAGIYSRANSGQTGQLHHRVIHRGKCFSP